MSKKFNPIEVRQAEDLMVDFDNRVREVVKIMFSQRRRIHSMGKAYLCGDDKTVTYCYWDGYDAEPYDNEDLEFPFEWLNKTDDELKAMYDSYWAEVDENRRRAKEAEKKREAEEAEIKRTIQESNEFKEYKKLKRLYEKYEN